VNERGVLYCGIEDGNGLSLVVGRGGREETAAFVARNGQ